MSNPSPRLQEHPPARFGGQAKPNIVLRPLRVIESTAFINVHIALCADQRHSATACSRVQELSRVAVGLGLSRCVAVARDSL